MHNRRHYRRYPVQCTGYITDSRFQKINFRVNDISACGMNITADKEIDDTQPLLIYFNVRGVPLPHAKNLKGKVVRKNLLYSTLDYSIRFLGLTHMEVIEIDEYLNYLQHNTVGAILAEDSDKLAMYY